MSPFLTKAYAPSNASCGHNLREEFGRLLGNRSPSGWAMEPTVSSSRPAPTTPGLAPRHTGICRRDLPHPGRATRIGYQFLA